MRATTDHRRRREQFMSDVLRLALRDNPRVTVTVTPGGTPNGADLVTARLGTLDVDGRTASDGFHVLYEDRLARGKATALSGVTTQWRDDMIHARSINDVSKLTQEDARQVLELGLRSLIA